MFASIGSVDILLANLTVSSIALVVFSAVMTARVAFADKLAATLLAEKVSFDILE